MSILISLYHIFSCNFYLLKPQLTMLIMVDLKRGGHRICYDHRVRTVMGNQGKNRGFGESQGKSGQARKNQGTLSTVWKSTCLAE